MQRSDRQDAPALRSSSKAADRSGTSHARPPVLDAALRWRYLTASVGVGVMISRSSNRSVRRHINWLAPSVRPRRPWTTSPPRPKASPFPTRRSCRCRWPIATNSPRPTLAPTVRPARRHHQSAPDTPLLPAVPEFRSTSAQSCRGRSRPRSASTGSTQSGASRGCAVRTGRPHAAPPCVYATVAPMAGSGA